MPTAPAIHALSVDGTGITEPLSERINLLGELLGRAVASQTSADLLDLIESLRLQSKDGGGTTEEMEALQERMQGLDLETIIWLLRAYTTFFHLVNRSEQSEIVRINRQRTREATADSPRPESIAEAIHRLKADGRTLDEVISLLGRLDIQPTLTAHPTEARRRSILFKQQRISDLMELVLDPRTPPDETRPALDEIENQITLMLGTDEVRAERLTVKDEVEHGLYFVRETIWDTMPRVVRDVRQALQTYYGEAREVPIFLRYRSWIGSDRDGNPNVTPAVTRHTMATQRRMALDLHLRDLRALRRELSLSDRQVSVPQALVASIERDAAELDLPPMRQRQFRHEPYRLKLAYMMLRVEALLDRLDEGYPPPEGTELPYSSTRFVEDLRLIERSLVDTGFPRMAHRGQLADLLVKAQTFGFHVMALDVRQHSRIHEETVAALLDAGGVTDRYATMDEAERLDLLSRELTNPRPLLPPDVDLPDAARDLLDTLRLIRDAVTAEPSTMGSYIVSMTHDVSDLLEVLLLAKETGLWSYRDGVVHTRLDVVPLFETIDDLEHAGTFMDTLFEHDLYRAHLDARGTFQELMLGYSDSNKDGGYWMANWALHKAQNRLGQVCRQHGVDFRLFHGRGGTIGRGGGRANQAILAMPPACQNGRIRFTEQGEVISFRYALNDIARRHLEQIVNAMLQATPVPGAEPDADAFAGDADPEAASVLMTDIATRSMEAYRALIDDPDLWPFYVDATPIEQISRLPIASRPVSRKGAGEVDFDSLRAIPWVFAWTQTRYIVPGWYGIGAALQGALDAGTADHDTLRAYYDEWTFFRAVVNNAQREMARARLVVAERYADLAARTGRDGRDRTAIHQRIVDDFQRAADVIRTITGQDALLTNNPVIRKSIDLRNPYTDVLNMLQIELLRRHRHATDHEKAELGQVLFLSINGIAAAMQSTG